MSGKKISAFIEAGPAGSDFISSWAGKPRNQVALVAEGSADLAGLKEVARNLHDRMGVVGWFSLDAWLECEGRRIGYCELGYTDYREALRRLVSGQ